MPKNTRVSNCVEDVKKKGSGVNPYAVCQSATHQSYATGKPLGKGKAMPGEEEMMEEEVGQEPMTHEEGNEEVFGAQVLRRMHKDALLLMQEYDEMKNMLENEEIKGKLHSKLEELETELTEIEELWETHYNNEETKLPPLEGSAKDMEGEEGEEMAEDEQAQEEIPDEEMVAEDEGTEGDGETEEEEAEPTTSEEEEAPTEEEAVEAMGERGEKGIGSHIAKAGQAARHAAGAAKRGISKVATKVNYAMGNPKVATAVGAGAGLGAGIAVGRASKKDFPELEDENEEAKNEAHHMGISFADHHHKNMEGAHGWLEEVGKTSTPDWSDEHRMKSYAWHKSMDSILDDFGYERRPLTEHEKGLGDVVQNAAHGATFGIAPAAAEEGKALEADGEKGVGGAIANAAGHVAGAARSGAAMAVPHIQRAAVAVKKGAGATGRHVVRNAGKYGAAAGGVAVGGAGGYMAGKRGKDIYGVKSTQGTGIAGMGGRALGSKIGPSGVAGSGGRAAGQFVGLPGGKDIETAGGGQDPETTPGYEEDQDVDHSVHEFEEEGQNPHMNSIANVSEHLHELSQTRNFGDEHRAKSLAYAKDLKDAMEQAKKEDEAEQSEVPDEEEEAFEPGEMGEKSLKTRGDELAKRHREQNKKFADFNNQILEVLQKLS